MARKLGIVTGNGRRSTPLTERKLEPEEIVGGQPLPMWSLQAVPLVYTVEEGQRRKRTRISYERESRKRRREDHVNARCKEKGAERNRQRKREITDLSLWPDLFFIFLFLSPFFELCAETVRGIELTSPTCWRPSEFLSRGPVKTFCS